MMERLCNGPVTSFGYAGARSVKRYRCGEVHWGMLSSQGAMGLGVHSLRERVER